VVQLSKIRILLADDRQFLLEKVASLLKLTFEVVGRVGDGQSLFEAAMSLKPDVLITDISMPVLSGIEAVRNLKESGCTSKVVFLTVHADPVFVRTCLAMGALGYVLKRRMATDLLPAIETVLAGGQFVSSDLKEDEVGEGSYAQAPHRHEVQFCSDDAVFLDSFTHFIAAALKAGNPALMFVTRSHGDNLLKRLRAEGVDVDAAIQQGTYISLDAADELSTIMVDGLPDPVRFFESMSGLIKAASTAAKAEHPRVAFCGERVGLLWAEGKTDAAIRFEQFCNELAKTHEVDILCAYPFCDFRGEEDERAFKRICAEHSAVHSR
jgi:DNA-binding NarL/FixJ family response regulator